MDGTAATGEPGEKLFGSAVERREDPALVTGDAEYTDDIRYPGEAYLALVRSQYGHAGVTGVDTGDAAAVDGVVAVYTAEDVTAAGLDGLPVGDPGEDGVAPRHPVLAGDRVRYQGEPVAAVVAEDRYAAHDAADAVSVDYDSRDTVTDPRGADAADAPTIHDEAPDNLAFETTLGDADATDRAFAAADRTVSVEVENNRVQPTPMEPRGAVAAYDADRDRLTVEMSTQNPHTVQDQLAGVLDVDEGQIRVRAPDVGGGFGAKLQPYAGHTLAAWAAMRLDRPVKWQARRTEDFLSTVHGRDHRSEAELAVDDDGTVRGLRVRTRANVGAYLTTGGYGVPTMAYGRMLTGQYDLPAAHLTVEGTFTNTTPVAAYRGAGRPEACYLIERAMSAAARDLGVDPAEFRRRNFVPADAFPYDNALGHTYDSGDYARTLDRALAGVDYERLRERQADLRGEGRYLGIGLSCYVEACGAAPGWVEGGAVRVKPSGEVVVGVGTADTGQGHATSFAQIVADRLGVPYDDIEVREADTAEVPEGGGTAGSRSAPVGGSAVAESAETVRERARRVAAHHLEAAPEDLEFADGTFHVAGAPDRSMRIQEVARVAHGPDLPEGMDPGLEATTFYDPGNYTFPFGTHVAVVEVDPASGEIAVERYRTVDDVGEQINPRIVEGQIHGGVAQGVGQALQEAAVYDESANLATGSLQDYAMPKSIHVPDMETDATVTPCPHNPLGVKGVGEAGTIAAPPAVVNAVLDALAPLGVDHLDMPLTAEKVWRATRDANG